PPVPRLAAVAAALAAASFAFGYAAGDRGRAVDFVVRMQGTRAAPAASARIEVFALDSAGNWPMELSVEGLRPAPGGATYELWLTRDGRLARRCGSFRAEPDGTTQVPMNAPWRLDRFDGWVVVRKGSREPLLVGA
ncbi:MAG TPA: anti-sigma factor, partial [Gaiellaceae bacterium]|nr:anti-sigma factor [Gaiellaceae bacterium]